VAGLKDWWCRGLVDGAAFGAWVQDKEAVMLKNVCPHCSNEFWNPIHKSVEGMRGWHWRLRMPHCPHCDTLLRVTKAAKWYQMGWLVAFAVLLNLVVAHPESISPYLPVVVAFAVAANLWLHHRLPMYERAE